MNLARSFRISCNAVFGGRTSRLFSALPPVLALALIWPFGGGTQINLMPGSLTPGAQGTVNIKKGGNGNTKLDINVSALAQPGSLTPSENAYVVWIEPPGHPAQNIGRITVNKHEHGELHAETPYKRFKLVITAQHNAQAQMPNGNTILSGTVTHH